MLLLLIASLSASPFYQASSSLTHSSSLTSLQPLHFAVPVVLSFVTLTPVPCVFFFSSPSLPRHPVSPNSQTLSWLSVISCSYSILRKNIPSDYVHVSNLYPVLNVYTEKNNLIQSVHKSQYKYCRGRYV